MPAGGGSFVQLEPDLRQTPANPPAYTTPFLAAAKLLRVSPFNPAVSNDMTRSIAGVTVGDDFMHKVGKSTVITQNLYFYPDLSDTGQYRGTFNFGTVTKINKWLGWQNSFGDVYVSDPPIGKKKNDILLSTGLNFSFTH